MSDALVTVVIPMHGLAPMTLDCIRSVQAGAPPHRIIVIDDASPDGRRPPRCPRPTAGPR